MRYTYSSLVWETTLLTLTDTLLSWTPALIWAVSKFLTKQTHYSVPVSQPLVSSSHKISIIALVYSVRFLFLLLCLYLIIPLVHLLKQSYYILSLLWIRSIQSLCENVTVKFRKISPGAYIFQRPLLRGSFLEELMCTEGNLHLASARLI